MGMRGAVAIVVLAATSLGGQTAPTMTVEQDCRALAYAPDGRLAYAVRRVISVRRVQMQRDDVWLLGKDGKAKRIVDGEKLVRSPTPYSYAIQSMRWSPDGTRLTAELLTRAMIDAEGNEREGTATLLLDETGKEIKIQGGDSVILEGTQATWLADGVTVAYLMEAAKPRLLFSVQTVRPISARGAALFSANAFVAVAWDAQKSAAVAIERNRDLSGPRRLVLLDLVKETRREIAVLENFLGGLTLSPTGMKAAYFTGHETLEVRNLAEPEKIQRIGVAYGNYQWAPDESRILIKRGMANRADNLVWVSLPDGAVTPVLSSLTFRDFQLAPDGRWLAVTSPGSRHLQIYAVP